MLTLSMAASLDYYLATVADPEAFGVLDDEISRVGYYNRRLDGDPLARPGIWFGRFAEALGLPAGSPVDARSFSNLYFGRRPEEGAPLTDDMPSIGEQRAASRRKAQAEAELSAAHRALNQARVTARRSGSDLDLDSAVMAAQDRLNRARANRRAVSNEAGARQPAHDLTFGAPKDISVLLMALHAEGRQAEARAIEAAFTRSVQAAMQTIERDFLLDRPRDGEGRRALQGIEGCASALFTHFDARPVDGVTDPHLHIHAVVFTPVQTGDGEVRAVYTRYLNHNQHVLGALQRALFAAELKTLGYALTPDIQDKISSFSLQGMRDGERSAFSQRAAQVEAAHREGLTGRSAKLKHRAAKFDRLDGGGLIELTGERLVDLGLTADLIAAPNAERYLREDIDRRLTQAWHEERQAILTHIPQSNSQSKPNTYNRGPAPGTPAWESMLDRRVAQAQQNLRSAIPDTPEAILEACLSMEARFGIRDIERRIWEAAVHVDIPFAPHQTPQEATIAWGQDMLRRILRHPDLLQVQYGDPDKPAHGPQGLDPHGLPVFTTRKQRARETEVYGRILPELAGANTFTTLTPEQARTAIDAWETAQQQSATPIRLTPNQRQAVADLVGSSSRLHVVSAWAGTGKTTMANAAVAILSGMGVEVLAVAPSNAAAEGLRKEIGASTAWTPERLALGIDNGTLILKPNSLLYIDEASMLDFAETHRLLDAVHRAGAKAVFQGDARQLQAVGMGNVLKRILCLAPCQLGSRPRIVSHLTQGFADHVHIQRQKENWAKQVVARAELGHVVRAFDEIDRRGLIERHVGEEDMLRAAVKGYADGAGDLAEMGQIRECFVDARGGADPAAAEARVAWAASQTRLAAFYGDRLMIASTNARVQRLNRLARCELKAIGLLDRAEVVLPGHKGKTLAVALGERLIFTEKADHGDIRFDGGGKNRVVKSTTGTVIDIRQGRGTILLRMRLDDGRRVEVDSGHFTGLDYAYALSVHKSQGVSVSRVEFVGSTFNNAELMLVALSRFRDRLRVHALEHEVEALRNSCGRVTEKLEANDLHAVDLGFIREEERVRFKASASEAAHRMDALGFALTGPTTTQTEYAPRRDPLAERVRAFVDRQREGGRFAPTQNPSGGNASAPTRDIETVPDHIVPSLPKDKREAVWAMIDAALQSQTVLDALRDELGLADEAMARRRWSGRAEDILDWAEEDGGGRAWEAAGAVGQGDTGVRGVVLTEDEERVYVAVATHGVGQQHDAHTRILALRREDASKVGRWVVPRAPEAAMERLR